MRSGTVIEKSGIYKCLFHRKNKQKFTIGTVLPRCDFAGLKCVGEWHLVKEIREKTIEEKLAAHVRRLELSDKARRRKSIKGWFEEFKHQEEKDWWKDRW
jgi:hypothetical protein